MNNSLYTIKSMLENKVDVVIECINEELYSVINPINYKRMKEVKTLRVIDVRSNCILVTALEGYFKIPVGELIYFNFVQTNFSMGEFINKSVDALLDGMISSVKISGKDLVLSVEDGMSNSVEIISNPTDGVKYIDSLYNTVITINDVSDFGRIQLGARGKLSNGSEFMVVYSDGISSYEDRLAISMDGDIINATIGILKGAEITQR